MLADPDDGQTATGKPLAINGFEASPDGKPFFLHPGSARRWRCADVQALQEPACQPACRRYGSGPGRAVAGRRRRSARDALYCEPRDGALKRLIRLPWDATSPVEVRIPVDGAVQVLAVSPAVDGVIAGVAAWTQAREMYAATPDPLAATGL